MDYTSCTVRFPGRSCSSSFWPSMLTSPTQAEGMILMSTHSVIAWFLGCTVTCFRLSHYQLGSWRAVQLCSTWGTDATSVATFLPYPASLGWLLRPLWQQRYKSESMAEKSWHNAFQESDETKKKWMFGLLYSSSPTFIILILLFKAV